MKYLNLGLEKMMIFLRDFLVLILYYYYALLCEAPLDLLLPSTTT